MSDPRKPDPFAAPIQLANMDLDPVRHVAKSTVSDLELVVTTVRTGAAHGFSPALHLLQTQIQDLNDKLGDLGFGDAPRALVFDLERENAAIGLGLLSGAVGIIREKLAAGGLVTDLESLEDQMSLLKRGLQLLADGTGLACKTEAAGPRGQEQPDSNNDEHDALKGRAGEPKRRGLKGYSPVERFAQIELLYEQVTGKKEMDQEQLDTLKHRARNWLVRDWDKNYKDGGGTWWQSLSEETRIKLYKYRVDLLKLWK